MTNTPGTASNGAEQAERAENTENMQQANIPNGKPTAEPTQATSASDTTKPEERSLEELLAEAKAKAEENLTGWQRERADFANFKKRVDKERDDIFQNAQIDALVKLLPVIDDFDRAITNLPAAEASSEAGKGLSILHRKFTGLMESIGVKVLNPQGEAFDPKYHEALGQDETSSVPSGHISAVLQKGYVRGDRVLRPALVRVQS